MMSASNMPIPDSPVEDATRVLLLPAFVFIDNVTPSNVPALIDDVINTAPVNMAKPSAVHPSLPADSQLVVRQCPYDYLVLLCSHKTRDARCGQSAPIIKKELERHLRPLGLLRDLHDDRPGGVGIYFVSHVGGHKFAANMLVYRRAGTPGAEYVPDADGAAAAEHANGAVAKMVVRDAVVTETKVEALECATLAEPNGVTPGSSIADANGSVVHANGQHEVHGNGQLETGSAEKVPSQINDASTGEMTEAKIDVAIEPSPSANGTTESGVPHLENGNKPQELDSMPEEKRPGVGQCIWLARVRPEDCENIVNYTILEGKVVKPQQQLRGGFDRCKQLSSW
jgi:hypothetical protein